MGVNVREKPAGSGEWWVFIHHNGKRKSKKIGKDKKLARDVAKKIEARLILGDMGIIDDSPPCPTIKEIASLWLDDIKHLRRESTHKRYSNIFKKYLLSAFGEKPVDQLKRNDAKNLLMEIYKTGISKNTVGVIHNVLSGIMVYALDGEIIESNPVSGIMRQLKIAKDEKSDIQPLTDDEVQLFLTVCYERYPEQYPFFLTAFRTGMRLGELLALKWDDIDWNSKFVWVKRSYYRGRVSPTKTGRMRKVDMSDQLIATMKELLSERKTEALQLGKGDEITEILFHRDNEYMEQKYIRRIFKRILRAAGLREIRLHDIRHTFASLLLSRGESPVYVKEQLGHSTIQMTVDIYGHLIPGSNRKAVNSLDNIAPKRTLSAP